jgi:3-oxoacyl-[acyl-carrier-protein] synthase-3
VGGLAGVTCFNEKIIIMQSVFVDHLSFALGDETYTVEQAAARESIVSAPDLLRQAGFAQHYVCRPGTTAYDLAQRAVQGIQTALGDIGAIVYSTCLPANANVGEVARFRVTRDVKYLMDFPASHLQSHFGLERATVIGLTQQACTGMLGSLRLARTLLIAEPDIQRVLCVTADRFPDGALYEQAYTLMSDGAAACIVSTVPAGFRLLALQAITNGGLAMASDDETVGSYFSYGYRAMQQTLAQAQLAVADIDWIVPQNVNIQAWHIFARLLQCDLGRVYCDSIAEIAHVISGDNTINLQRLLAAGKISPGQRVLLFMAGYGLNWQCAILEKC